MALPFAEITLILPAEHAGNGMVALGLIAEDKPILLLYIISFHMRMHLDPPPCTLLYTLSKHWAHAICREMHNNISESMHILSLVSRPLPIFSCVQH